MTTYLNQIHSGEWPQGGERELLFTGGKVLTQEGVRESNVYISDGIIKDITDESLINAELINLSGDYLLPGMVELHTDNLERHLMPRPGIYWSDALGALEAHDREMASSGITTVFDSICVGESVDKGRVEMLKMSLEAYIQNKASMRVRHLLHIRCEISSQEMGKLFDNALKYVKPDLLSIMDHTPWQRQWRQIEDWAKYNRKIMDLDELTRDALKIKEVRDKCAKTNIEKVVNYARTNNVPLATHDDTEISHINDALEQGAVISEFPTTMEAALKANEAGLTVIMGTPNLIRQKSHSGNVLASDVAKAGHLSCLSSDYVPSSLIQGAFSLWLEHGYSFQDALATVTRNPAKAASLSDRGNIAPCLKADLIRVSLHNKRPRIESVWVEGSRVF
jgi:alpha-D-ribose 1-methylphosphonate 5-triphosphate diphosphatase